MPRTSETIGCRARRILGMIPVAELVELIPVAEIVNISKKVGRMIVDAAGHQVRQPDPVYPGRPLARMNRNVIALGYRDLYPNEISMLTKILSRPPPQGPKGTPARIQKYQKSISEKVESLPKGCKIGDDQPSDECANHMCPAHRRLNPRPLEGIFLDLAWEMEERLSETWIAVALESPDLAPDLAERLQEVQKFASLWAEPEANGEQTPREPGSKFCYQEDLCVPCILSRVGADSRSVQLLGATILGGMGAERFSTRMDWCEGWLRAVLGDDRAMVWIEDMYTLGQSLRMARKTRKEAASLEERKANESVKGLSELVAVEWPLHAVELDAEPSRARGYIEKNTVSIRDSHKNSSQLERGGPPICTTSPVGEPAEHSTHESSETPTIPPAAAAAAATAATTLEAASTSAINPSLGPQSTHSPASETEQSVVAQTKAPQPPFRLLPPLNLPNTPFRLSLLYPREQESRPTASRSASHLAPDPDPHPPSTRKERPKPLPSALRIHIARDVGERYNHKVYQIVAAMPQELQSRVLKRRVQRRKEQIEEFEREAGGAWRRIGWLGFPVGESCVMDAEEA